MSRLSSILGLVALAVALAACSGASGTSGTPGTVATGTLGPFSSGAPSPSTGSTGNTTTITAKNLQFVERDVTVKAGAPLAIVFDNKDGSQHNIAIYDSAHIKVFEGSKVAGQTVTYDVPALAAGTYRFVCEIHHEMNGTITAK